jgi:hypothetical protein
MTNLDGFRYSALVANWPRLGFLPIVLLGNQEVYRGEYRRTREEAIFAAFKFIDSQENSNA